MKRILLLIYCLAISSSANAQSNEIVIGETVSIHSNILDEDRTVMVYIPDNYQNGNEKYPTIYILDGRDHFLHTAGIVQFLSDANMAPKMIVIAVANLNRTLDFTISSDDEQKYKGGGGAEQYSYFDE